MTPLPSPGVARTASAGLCLACLFTVGLSSEAHPSASRSARDAASQSSSERCNPAPEATAEDMRLAVAVLQDTTQMAHWGSVAWYLGELGSPESFEPLRHFVWATHGHGDSVHYTLGAMTAAQTSIGHVAASNPAALDYLIQSTNPSFWKELPWKDSQRTALEMRSEMSKASIQGLGLSGAPEAGQMLSRLRQWPYAETQRETIEEAFRKFRHVSLVRKYSPAELRRISRLHLPELLPEVTDKSLIFGAWRWMRSSYSGGYYAPPACGWSRTLILEPDSTYSFWEEDSVDVYRISSGRFIVHTTAERQWIEFEGWSGDDSKIYWPRIMGSDLLALRPGGSQGVWHSMGATLTFERERAISPRDRKIAHTWRPPRILRTSQSYCSIEVPLPLPTRSGLAGSRRWSFYRGLGPKEYEYTHYQIPSGVIGDFDGDSLADVAILGYDDDKRNVVTCLLSNRGAPHAVVAWTERGSGTKDRPTRPLHYLELVPSGRSYVDSRGKRMTLVADAIGVTGKLGGSSILSYENGQFHHAKISRHSAIEPR